MRQSNQYWNYDMTWADGQTSLKAMDIKKRKYNGQSDLEATR